MRSDDLAQYLKTQTVSVVTGVTNAVYVAPLTGQLDTRIAYVSGGSMLMFGATGGMTLAAATLVAYFNSGSYYMAPGTNMLTIMGPAGFYLAATGATSVVTIVQGYSSADGRVN